MNFLLALMTLFTSTNMLGHKYESITVDDGLSTTIDTPGNGCCCESRTIPCMDLVCANIVKDVNRAISKKTSFSSFRSLKNRYINLSFKKVITNLCLTKINLECIYHWQKYRVIEHNIINILAIATTFFA